MNKITFVFPYNSWGGAFRSSYILCNHLLERGWRVEVVFPLVSPSPHLSTFTFSFWTNLVRSLLRSVIRRGKVPFSLKAKTRVIPWISDRFIGKRDVVVANHFNTVFAVNALSKSVRRFHYIRDIEEWASYWECELDGFKLPIEKIAVADWIRQRLKERYGIAPVAVVTNGTYAEPFLCNGRDYYPEVLCVGFCYSTHPMKGNEFGINALKEIKKRFPDTKIIIFGFEEPKLKGFDYEFINRPTGEQLLQVYAGIDIFVSSSIQEGFHNPPREAMVSGAAVVATNVGCVPDVGEHMKNMYICEPGNADALIEGVSFFINHPSKRVMIAKNGHKDILQQGWESRVDQFIDIVTG